MFYRIISAILVAFTIVVTPDVIHGQSIDSLLYLIDNDLVEDDADKYDLLIQVVEDINDTDSIIRYCDQAIELAQGLDILPALPYLIKGEECLISGKLVLAFECFLQVASFYEELEDDSELARAYLLMANVYNVFRVFPENEKLYLQKAVEIFEQQKDTLRFSFALHNLAYTTYSMGQYDSALVIYNESLDLFKQLDPPTGPYAYFTCLGNMGLVYSGRSDFDKAEEYLLTAIDTLTKLGNELAVAEFMSEYASILEQKGEIRQAITYASGALKNTDNPYFQREASRLLARLYENSGRFDSAYHYQSISIIADEGHNNETVLKIADLLNKYEVGRVQAEVDALEKIKLRNSIIIIGLGIILLLAIALVTLYNTNLRRSRKLTVALEERRVLLEKQSAELKERNDEILMANEELKQLNEITSRQKDEIISSMNYAQRIQSAMLPPEPYFYELLDEAFILFKPKEIISGDFYWIKQVHQFIILVAADCTGHGIPGALMSMLGMSYLNEIVQRREITKPGQVLDELRDQVKRTLRQHGQPDESKDSIDMAICVLDKRKRILQFSGAYNPLYLIQDESGASKLNEIKADKMPVGFYQGRAKPFTNHEIQLAIGDTFYIFSDGFIDQKGGKDNRKFMSTNFKKLLLKIHEHPMYEQKNILEKTLEDWIEDHAQMDDILVIGGRV